MARERGWPPTPDPLPGPVVDDHTHLLMALDVTADGWAGADAYDAHLARAAAGGVVGVVEVGCDLDALAATAAATAHPMVLGAIAIHPNEAVLHAGVREVAPDGLAPDPQPRHGVPLDEALARVAAVAAATPRIRAIGETGLDHFRAGPAGRAVQREAFRAHVALAKELDLTLQIHDRDAHGEVVATLLADGAPARTVFHCFSGDVELARVCAEHGWYASFAGPLTFSANDGLRAAAAVLPDELLMVETDAPFLTPAPWRGRPNSSYLVGLTLATLARVRAADLAVTCETTTANARRVYGDW